MNFILQNLWLAYDLQSGLGLVSEDDHNLSFHAMDWCSNCPLIRIPSLEIVGFTKLLVEVGSQNNFH